MYILFLVNREFFYYQRYNGLKRIFFSIIPKLEMAKKAICTLHLITELDFFYFTTLNWAQKSYKKFNIWTPYDNFCWHIQKDIVCHFNLAILDKITSGST